MTRGPKKGTVREGSFVNKIRSIRVGESIMLDDTAGKTGPTRLERDLQTQLARSPALAGRKFQSARVRWIDGDRLSLALRVTRLE